MESAPRSGRLTAALPQLRGRSIGLVRQLRSLAPEGGFSVGAQVIAPFVVLSLVLGLITSAIVSQQLAASAAGRLDALAIKEQDAVGGSFDSFEQRQLTDLRLMAGTQGVPGALALGRSSELTDLLYPAVANQLPDPLQATVVDRQGHDIVTMRADPGQPSRCLCTSGGTVAAWPHVGDVLRGVADASGPKYAGIVQTPASPLFYTTGPVMNGTSVVGAIVVAEPLDELLATIHHSDGFALGLFAPDGTPMASTPDLAMHAGDLPAAERAAVVNGTAAAAVHHPVTAAGRAAEVFFVPLVIRARSAGYAAVVVPSSVIGDAEGRLPLILVLIFLVGLLFTVLAGAFVTRRITRPLARLLEATDQVAAGDLEHEAPGSSTIEVGKLAAHFNAMTASLRQKNEQLEANTEETVRALAAAIDARDAYTHGHSVRVADYSVALAQAAGLTPERVETLRRGCLIHDIGKIGVPDRILGKKGRLTRAEEAEMRTHPVLGHRMLQHLRWYGDVLEVVLHHHERWDGQGYPERLEGEAIPLLARLTAIADTLDAMTSHRPYRKAFSFNDAAAEIEAAAGTQFDPAMVEIFKATRQELKRMVEAEFSVGGPDDVTPSEAMELVS